MDLSGTGPGFSWDFNFIKKLARENEFNMSGLDVAGYRNVVDAIAADVRARMRK